MADIELPASVLTKHQVKTYGPKEYIENRRRYRITARVRWDDHCGNKRNCFVITADIDMQGTYGWQEYAGGMCHEEVAKHFPELAPFLKWHGTYSDGPTYYIENTLYWLGWRGYADGKPGSPPNLEHARNTAVWPELPEDFIAPTLPPGGTYGNSGEYRKNHSLGLFKQLEEPIKAALLERLPALMQEFKRDVESLGFTY
jgi:hypothetical protein